jgi:hypothetical protein
MKPFGDFTRVAQVGVDDLHRHLAPESSIASAIDARHAPVTNLLHELVLGELRQPS